MQQIEFVGANSVLTGGPKEEFGTEDDVVDLVCWRGPGMTISCWQLTWRERLGILFGGSIWLSMLTTHHPAVRLGTERPEEIR